MAAKGRRVELTSALTRFLLIKGNEWAWLVFGLWGMVGWGVGLFGFGYVDNNTKGPFVFKFTRTKL